MSIDSINFSLTCGGEESSKITGVLQRINKEKIMKNQGKTGIAINKKQKKHIKTKR